MALMLKSGMPLLDSLKTPARPSTITALFRRPGVDPLACLPGNTLSKSMESTALFTPMVLSVTKLGEESGKLGDVLEQVSNYYSEILEVTVTQVTGMLEPLIVIFMGVVVGGCWLPFTSPCSRWLRAPAEGVMAPRPRIPHLGRAQSGAHPTPGMPPRLGPRFLPALSRPWLPSQPGQWFRELGRPSHDRG